MKFSLFAHMERVDHSHSQAQLYDEFIQLCQIADQGGMCTIWTGEHHGMDFTIAPNPFISLVDIANKTKNVRLGTGTIVAPFWHPIKLAGEAAMTDLITKGRLELGLARGAYSYEYERLSPGLDAWQAGQRLREIVPAIKNLWRGDYQHEGEFYQFPSTSSSPKPLQDGGPPIWLAARDPNTHEFAVANDCNVQVTPLWQGMQEVEQLMHNFQAAKTQASNNNKSKIMLLQHGYVGKDQAEIDQALNSINRFYCYFGSWFMNKRPVSQGLLKELSQDEMRAMEMYTPDKLLNNMPIGTAETVVEKLKIYQNLGYDEFSFWIDSSMSFARKRDSLERFINDVMPQF
ncbi:MAG: alkanesulfonate monooxygenase SsuD [Arenicella sp.]|jgi:alkanesulfonate monooxygenase SsuD/methylene tetrahydromethanopterin reductase-like flavin-dependent oxidoreductase (luciferase family)